MAESEREIDVNAMSGEITVSTIGTHEVLRSTTQAEPVDAMEGCTPTQDATGSSSCTPTFTALEGADFYWDDEDGPENHEESDAVSPADQVPGEGDASTPQPPETPTSGGTLRPTDYSPPRGMWGHRLDFFFSYLGSTVGLGAVWRFPYLLYRHGGGAFLFPYVLFLLTIGIPLLYLEMSLGQYACQGTTHVWMLAPLFGGIGYAMVAVSLLVATYYNVIVSWILYYLFASMSRTPPWTTCGNSWSSPGCCVSRIYIDNCTLAYPEWLAEDANCLLCVYNVSDRTDAGHGSQLLTWDLDPSNDSLTIVTTNHSAVSPSEDYFHDEVLGLSDDVSDVGTVQWRLLLCLFLAWAIVFSAVSCGIRSSGKLVYATSLLPYVLMIGLLAKNATLEGAREGIIYLLKPRWERLKDGMVWRDAASQVLFTLGPCYGSVLTLSSYNSFTHNFYRDATLIPVLSLLSSLLAGAVVFSALGHLAWRLRAPLDNIVTSKFSLTFITYPDAVADQHPVVTGLFFLLLLLLALDTVLPFVQTLMAAVLDQNPALQRKPRYTTFVALGTCGLLFACGIPLVTKGGLYLLEIVDTHATTWPTYLLGALECLLVTWLYGFAKLQNNVWVMIGKRPGKWWHFMWGIITPVLLVGLLVYSIVADSRLSYKDQYLPQVANIASWSLSSMTLLIILLFSLYTLIITPGSTKERLQTGLRPPKKWGPSGTFADFLSHQFWTLPEYMVSEKEEVVNHPLVWKRRHSLGTTTDGEAESISTLEGYLTSPTGAQKGDNIDTGSVQWSEDENKVRGNWSGRFDFLVSGLGYSVGIGNVWRFPYVVYKNGGGSFFLPYLLMLFFCGIPLFYMELSLGQFASVGPITVWRVSPLFKGVGYAAVVTMFLVCIYYNVFAAWSVYYIAASMTSNLPWSTCNNTWNTPDCRERSFYNQTFCNRTQNTTEPTSGANITWDYTTQAYVYTADLDVNDSCIDSDLKYPSPSAEYFFNEVLGISSGVDEPGGVRWYLALSLLFCWAITFIGLIKGVKSAGKVVYVTVLFPYIILMMLLIRFVTLDTDAHLYGIKYYVTPQWEALGRAEVWGDAASQLFFSLGLCMGGLTALGSYNRFHYNCFRDAYMICCIDTVTSVFAGFVIFAILGVMATEQNTEIENVVESSFALAYIAYPDAVTRLPMSTAWSILFFVMMFMLAVDSQFLMMETIVIAVMDEFSRYLWRWRIWVIFGLCVVMFLLGLPLVTQGGVYLLVLVDAHVAAWSPLVIGILMCVSLAWVYKVEHFCTNIKTMLGTEPRWWWRLMWKICTPAILLFILLFSWIMYKPTKMDDYEYPLWAQALGIIMSLTPILCIPVVMLVQFFTSKQPLKETIRQKTRPDPDWGPALQKHKLSCFLPGMFDPEESMARIAQWVATGLSNTDVESPHSDNGRIDPLPAAISQISQQNIDCLRTIADDSSVNGYVSDVQRRWAHAAKLVLQQLHSPGGALISNGHTVESDAGNGATPVVKKRKNNKLRVTFPHERILDEHCRGRSMQPVQTNTELVDKSTQTDASFLISLHRRDTLKDILQIKAELHHSYDNPSFQGDEGLFRAEEVLPQQKSPSTASARGGSVGADSERVDSGISSPRQVHSHSREETRLRRVADSVTPVQHAQNDNGQEAVDLSSDISYRESHVGVDSMPVISPEAQCSESEEDVRIDRMNLVEVGEITLVESTTEFDCKESKADGGDKDVNSASRLGSSDESIDNVQGSNSITALDIESTRH